MAALDVFIENEDEYRDLEAAIIQVPVANPRHRASAAAQQEEG